MACKVESKLYEGLKNHSNPEISSRADMLYNRSQTPQFKAVFGDYQRVNDLAGEGSAHSSRIKGYVDENGAPTVEAFLQTLEDIGTRIEDIPVNMLKVGVELEEESVPAEITKMQARVQQRINRLKQTKMAPEKLLNETFSRQALENLSPEEETQLLREIYRRKQF